MNMTKNTWGTLSLSLSLALGALAPALAGTPMSAPTKKSVVVREVPAPKPEAYWSLSAGAVYRGFGDVNFETGSRSAGYALPRLARRGSHSGGPGLYDNGYVLPDGGTFSGGLGSGTTGYWGYDNSSQFNPEAETLTFSGTRGSGSLSTSRRGDSADWSDDDNGSAGPIVELSYLIPLNRSVRVGPQLGFMWASFDASETTTDFRARQIGRGSRSSITAIYDASPALSPIPSLPPAPYVGGASGPGRPRIAAFPSSSTLTPLSSTRDRVDFYNRIREELDVDVYTFSFGGVADFENERFFGNLGAGLALNVVDWEASHTEELFADNGKNVNRVKKWTDNNDDTDILLGFYLQGVVGVKINGPWYIGAMGRYDWNEELNGTVGPSSFSADLNAWTVGGVVGGRF